MGDPLPKMTLGTVIQITRLRVAILIPVSLSCLSAVVLFGKLHYYSICSEFNRKLSRVLV